MALIVIDLMENFVPRVLPVQSPAVFTDRERPRENELELGLILIDTTLDQEGN